MTSNNAVLAANSMSLGFKQQLDAVWQNNLPIIRDRIASLEIFVSVITTGVATPQQHGDALNIAHKFSGSLGMFGYPTGSQLARALEHLLRSTPIPDPERVRDIVRSIRSTLNL
jgi:HPt (histidine-containing phosphotransfer) domain-containing protein